MIANAGVRAAANVMSPRGTAGLPDEVELIELRDVPLDAEGFIAPQSIELPEDVQSVMISAVGDPAARYRVTDVQGPNGEVIIGPGATANPSYYSQQVANVVIPNNQGASISPGKHTFRIRGAKSRTEAATGTVDLRVFIKRKDGQRGRINLNLHFTGAGGISAAQARNNPNVQRAIEEMREIYASANIEIGQINYKDTAPGHALVNFGTNPERPDAMDMFMQTPEQPGINVFFVDHTGSDGVAGRSGFDARPGNPFGGSFQSGVVVKWYDLADIPDSQTIPEERRAAAEKYMATISGAVMAHEVGHFLGLSHTIEQDGVTRDPISDTDGADNTNIMKQGRSGSANQVQLKFSPNQAQALRNNPLVDTFDAVA
jgi:hypothetical protein